MWRWGICTGICNFGSYVGVRTSVNACLGIEKTFNHFFLLLMKCMVWKHSCISGNYGNCPISHRFKVSPINILVFFIQNIAKMYKMCTYGFKAMHLCTLDHSLFFTALFFQWCMSLHKKWAFLFAKIMVVAIHQPLLLSANILEFLFWEELVCVHWWNHKRKSLANIC